MENNELSKKIIENVRNRVVISNLESEENMKLNKRKQVLSLITVMLVLLTGSFITVNATSNGEVVDQIKDKIKVIFVKDDGKEEQLKGSVYTDSNNHKIEKFEVENNGMEFTTELDKTILDDANLTVHETIKNDEAYLVIENK